MHARAACGDSVERGTFIAGGGRLGGIFEGEGLVLYMKRICTESRGTTTTRRGASVIN